MAIHVGKPDESIALAVHLMDLTGKERVEAFNSKHLFSNEIYSAIRATSKKFPLRENKSLYQILLIHIDQYKNNLYGIHLKNQDVHGVEGLSSFIEEYVRRFAIEVSACFASCSHNDLEVLTRQVEQEIVSIGRDYEDALELKKLLALWKESRTGT